MFILYVPEARDIFPGRCISADHVAHASTRIQGTCCMTGQASGTAAALSVKNKTTVGQLNVNELINTLENDGIYLGK